MTYDFASHVQQVIGPVLLGRGFVLDAVDSQVDEGGRWGSVVYYRQDNCKVQIYLSTREGEVNAMIAPRDAPNEYGLRNRSKKWRYFASFAERPKMTLEELVRAVPVPPQTDDGRLQFVKRTIEDNIDGALDWATDSASS